MFTIVHKKQGMKALLKRLALVQCFTASAGLHKGDGRQIVRRSSKRGKSINFATLARILESSESWVQGKAANIMTAAGNFLHIPAGTRMLRPARPFIRIWRCNPVWRPFRNHVKQLAISFIRNRVKPKDFMNNVAQAAVFAQKRIIQSGQAAKNSELTIAIKGENHPLKHTGKLLSMLKGKCTNGLNGESKSVKGFVKASLMKDVDNILNDFSKL